MIAPLPPPVHGSSMMTQYIKDSKRINEAFELDWVNLSTSRAMTEIGKKSIKKIFRFINSYVKTFHKLLIRKYSFCYLAITCHGNGFLKDAPFALLCKLFGRKLIIHQHNKGMDADVDKPLFRFIFKTVYRNSRVILLSERLYPDIKRIVDHNQVIICPNGIPQATQYPRQENKISKLLFLSNLIESKGVIVLLDACKILKDKGYSFTCEFVGGETKEIDGMRFNTEVKNRGLEHIAFYLGKKYGEEKNKIISGCDIFVFPTFYSNECFPLVLLEAMQQGKPIVTSTEGGIPDIIVNDESGYTVEAKNTQQLANKLAYLLNNPDIRLRQGEISFENYKNKYTKDRFENNILRIFESMEQCVNR